jgi:hypothetical protein
MGVDAGLLEEVAPFPTSELVQYDPSFLAGWTVELYQIDLVEAAQQSRTRMDAKVRAMCGRKVPGDTYRNLVVDSNYSDQTFRHILAPVWVVSYRYGAKSYQVVVNGVTGRVGGRYPKSWIKILIAVSLVIIVIGVIVYFGQQYQK